jgi:hypothetical protein
VLIGGHDRRPSKATLPNSPLVRPRSPCIACLLASGLRSKLSGYSPRSKGGQSTGAKSLVREGKYVNVGVHVQFCTLFYSWPTAGVLLNIRADRVRTQAEWCSVLSDEAFPTSRRPSGSCGGRVALGQGPLASPDGEGAPLPEAICREIGSKRWIAGRSEDSHCRVLRPAPPKAPARCPALPPERALYVRCWLVNGAGLPVSPYWNSTATCDRAAIWAGNQNVKITQSYQFRFGEVGFR